MKTKKRRPWNAVSEQVYSISSQSAAHIPNMNIATYVMPVTMDPKRYCVAVYKHTQTHLNIFKTKQPFLLQALSHPQIQLVKTLGKKSGLTIDKYQHLQKKGIPMLSYGDCVYLSESYFVLALIPESYTEVGDHDLVVARVEKIVLYRDVGPLTTTDLQTVGIIG